MIDPHQCFQFENVQRGETLSAHWNVPEDLPYLQGHFPGQPIVPAVAILDATAELIGQEICEVKNAKFTKPLEPKQTVAIECKKIAEREWTSDWKVAGELVAKLYFATC